MGFPVEEAVPRGLAFPVCQAGLSSIPSASHGKGPCQQRTHQGPVLGHLAEVEAAGWHCQSITSSGVSSASSICAFREWEDPSSKACQKDV